WREDAQTFIRGRRAVVDDIHALEQVGVGGGVAAVGLLPLHAVRRAGGRAQHRVDPGGFPATGDSLTGDVSTQEPGHAAREDLHEAASAWNRALASSSAHRNSGMYPAPSDALISAERSLGRHRP